MDELQESQWEGTIKHFEKQERKQQEYTYKMSKLYNRLQNVKRLIKHYSLMLEKVAKTEVQKEFYTKLLEFHKKLLERIEEDE